MAYVETGQPDKLMLAFSPQLFATVVTGALRLGREGYNAYLHVLMDDQDIRAFVPLTSSVDPTCDRGDQRTVSWLVVFALLK